MGGGGLTVEFSINFFKPSLSEKDGEVAEVGSEVECKLTWTWVWFEVKVELGLWLCSGWGWDWFAVEFEI